MLDVQRQAGDVEALTRAYGRQILAYLQDYRPMAWSPAWWDERLMEATMGNEALKTQLFRFVDVLPMLRDDAAVTRHLHEYFAEAGPHLPILARFAVNHMPMRGWPARLLAWTARRSAQRLARRFIAGHDIDQTLRVIGDLRRQGLAFTVDLLGEATVTETEAEKYQEDYLELVDGLCEAVNTWPTIDAIDRDPFGPLPRVNLSIKLSSLFSQFDPIDPDGTSQAVRERLRPILQATREQGAFVNFDMEQYAFKDLTLRIFREILEEPDFRDWPDVGIAIQVYLHDTARDVEELAAWAERRGTPVWVRLIKGAYWDYEIVIADQQGWLVPVFTHKAETDANYERLTRFLLERYAVLRPAFGSHNVRSLAHVLATAQALRVPERAFEIQMLYGMAGPLQDAVTRLGQRVRIYTPVGELLPGMAYLVRRLLENTANESFLRASGTERVAEETLLMNPLSGVRNQESHGRAGGLTLRSSQESSEAIADGVASNGLVSEWQFKNEPLADFSRASEREAMRKALADVAGQMGRRYSPIIGGREVATPRLEDSINPSHKRQIVGRWGCATPAQAEEAIASAKAAFAAWRNVTPRDRAEYLFRAANVMRRRRFELAAWQVYECGKQWREADGDVAEAIDYCDYYGQEMLRLAVPHHRDVGGEENIYTYEPRGVTVVIAPWNFPLAILCGMTTAALVTGNPVIMKPAEQSAIVGAKLMEVFREVGLPAGVAHYLPGLGEDIGPVLTRHPDVAMIAFTGSRDVGLLINREAAASPGRDQIKRVLAEMGGKNAVIIDDDADLDEAVRGVVASAFGYQGEKCSACSRVIVLEAIYDQFLSRLVEAARSLKVGPAEDPANTVGPVIDSDALDRIQHYIERGKEDARLVFAGDVTSLADEGYYVAPHIFADVPPAAAIAQEEIFGPVLAVLRARDLDDALNIANATLYALTGGLFSRSPKHIARIKRELIVGNLYINRKITGALVDRQPFGGFRLSGIGSKAGGPDYLLQFVQPRTITENTMRRGFAPVNREEETERGLQQVHG